MRRWIAWSAFWHLVTSDQRCLVACERGHFLKWCLTLHANPTILTIRRFRGWFTLIVKCCFYQVTDYFKCSWLSRDFVLSSGRNVMEICRQDVYVISSFKSWLNARFEWKPFCGRTHERNHKPPNPFTTKVASVSDYCHVALTKMVLASWGDSVNPLGVTENRSTLRVPGCTGTLTDSRYGRWSGTRYKALSECAHTEIHTF